MHIYTKPYMNNRLPGRAIIQSVLELVSSVLFWHVMLSSNLQNFTFEIYLKPKSSLSGSFQESVKKAPGFNVFYWNSKETTHPYTCKHIYVYAYKCVYI